MCSGSGSERTVYTLELTEDQFRILYWAACDATPAESFERATGEKCDPKTARALEDVLDHLYDLLPDTPELTAFERNPNG